MIDVKKMKPGEIGFAGIWEDRSFATAPRITEFRIDGVQTESGRKPQIVATVLNRPGDRATLINPDNAHYNRADAVAMVREWITSGIERLNGVLADFDRRYPPPPH